MSTLNALPDAELDCTTAEAERIARLRLELFRVHGVNIPARDPLITEYTVFSRVVDDLLSRAREDREQELEELRAHVRGVGASVAHAIDGAGRPLARAMGQVLDPSAIADRVCSELFDDMRRVTRKLVRDAITIVIAIGLATIAMSFVLLLAANERLAAAKALPDLCPPAVSSLESGDAAPQPAP